MAKQINKHEFRNMTKTQVQGHDKTKEKRKIQWDGETKKQMRKGERHRNSATWKKRNKHVFRNMTKQGNTRIQCHGKTKKRTQKKNTQIQGHDKTSQSHITNYKYYLRYIGYLYSGLSKLVLPKHFTGITCLYWESCNAICFPLLLQYTWFGNTLLCWRVHYELMHCGWCICLPPYFRSSSFFFE